MNALAGRGIGAGRSLIVLSLLAVVLSAPMLSLGTILASSSPHSLLWATQFAEQFRAGILYPRWLADSFNGLGAPTFYFYAPLTFWLDALVNTISFNVLPVSYRLGVTSFLILCLSGVAMYAWLWHETRNRPATLVGTAAYMAAPYHMLDLYVRGALAEYSAYAVLPLVMLAIRLVADGSRRGMPFLSLSYAALLMTHLPTSLLATLTVVPSYVLFRAWRLGARHPAVSLVGRAMIAGMLGIGLAAIYLVPALSLQEWISSEVLWAYRPENWLALSPERWIEPSPHLVMRFVIFLIVSALLVALGLCALWPLMVVDKKRRVEVAFWVAMILTVVALVGGLVPWFWSLPLVGLVQFPWRLLLVLEFAAITALCLAFTGSWKVHRRSDYVSGAVAAALLVAAAAALAPCLRLLAIVTAARIEVTASGPPLRQFEANEYLPRGYGQVGTLPELGAELLPSVPKIACAPAATVCQAEDAGFGALAIVVESAAPTTVTVRRFAFPGWRVSAGLPVVATDWQLVSFVAPPGRTRTSLERMLLPAEKRGIVISALSGVFLVFLSASSSRGVRGLSTRFAALVRRLRRVEASDSSSSGRPVGHASGDGLDMVGDGHERAGAARDGGSRSA